MRGSDIRGILFDKDGTLFDFRSMWLPAYKAAAEMLVRAAGKPGLDDRLLCLGGCDPDGGALDPDSPLACGTMDAIVNLWMTVPAVAQVPDVSRRILTVLGEAASRDPQPATDLAALFEGLRARGLKLGVVTADGTAAAKVQLAAAGVERLLDFVAGYDSGFGAKPDPGPIRAFCVQTALVPQQVAVVGDSIVDMAMGNNGEVGLKVGVLGGVAPRATLEPLADRIIDGVGDIAALLESPPIGLHDRSAMEP